jgi:hypothetical protein
MKDALKIPLEVDRELLLTYNKVARVLGVPMARYVESYLEALLNNLGSDLSNMSQMSCSINRTVRGSSLRRPPKSSKRLRSGRSWKATLSPARSAQRSSSTAPVTGESKPTTSSKAAGSS